MLVPEEYIAKCSVWSENWWASTPSKAFDFPGGRMCVYSLFLDILGGFSQGSTNTFASIFEVWSRKKHNFLLHWKFSLLSTQQNCAGNNRNKTSRLSTSFCTKNHQDPFTSLRERVVWRYYASSKKVPKPKTRILVMYERNCTWMCSSMYRIRVFGFEHLLELVWHLQTTRSRRLINGSWWFLVHN